MERGLIILIGTVVACGSGSATGGEDDAGPEATTVDSVKIPDALKSLISSREALHSGTCRASWTWTVETATKSVKDEGTWKISFDYDKGLSRIDRQVATTVRRQPQMHQVFAQRFRNVKRIDTPLEMITYVEGVASIGRKPPGSRAFLHAEPFDVRTVGLAQLTSVRGEDATWQKWVDYARRQGDFGVSENPDGKLQLTWGWEGREVKDRDRTFFDSLRLILWIDPAQHCSPVRNEIWHGTGPTKQIRLQMVEVIEAESTEKNGVFVPVRCHWSMPIHKHEAELTFQWDSINSPISETSFTPEALGAPPGTYVFRQIGNEPAQIQYILGQPGAMRHPN
jgi:hypothetical protein